MSSLVIYRLMCLLSPPRKLFIEYKEIIGEFLWNGKGSKIRYDKLIQTYEYGGIKLVDLQAKDIAMKATWVHRALGNTDTNYISPIYYKLPIQNSLIWECNTTFTDICNMPSSYLLSFQVWATWSRINVLTPQNILDVLDQTLWYNHQIKRALKMWYIPEASMVGLNKLCDIYDIARQRFLTYEEMVGKFGNCMDHLSCHSLIVSIANMWRIILRQSFTGMRSPVGLAKVPQGLKLSQYTYSKTIELMKNETTSEEVTKILWEQELKIVLLLQEKDWDKVQNDTFGRFDKT